MMRLTAAELATMREHHMDCDSDSDSDCDAARLLAHFAPGPVPHLAGIAMGLLGPVSSDELPQPKPSAVSWKQIQQAYDGTVRLPVEYGAVGPEPGEAKPSANGQASEKLQVWIRHPFSKSDISHLESELCEECVADQQPSTACPACGHVLRDHYFPVRWSPIRWGSGWDCHVPGCGCQNYWLSPSPAEAASISTEELPR